MVLGSTKLLNFQGLKLYSSEDMREGAKFFARPMKSEEKMEEILHPKSLELVAGELFWRKQDLPSMCYIPKHYGLEKHCQTLGMNELTFNGKPKSRMLEQNITTFDCEKSRRSLEEFKTFCNFILAYEATEEAKKDMHSRVDRTPSSPSSTGSGSSLSSALDSLNDDMRKPRKRTKQRNSKSAQNEEYDSDDESWELVTCFCMKPFAGRPMIECSLCQIWVHLSCAKIRRSNIPELFICPKCREEKPNQSRTLVNKFDERKHQNLNQVTQANTKSKKRVSLGSNSEELRGSKERKTLEV